MTKSRTSAKTKKLRRYDDADLPAIIAAAIRKVSGEREVDFAEEVLKSLAFKPALEKHVAS
eukprot:5880469-Prymnesium_polylepis.1